MDRKLEEELRKISEAVGATSQNATFLICSLDESGVSAEKRFDIYASLEDNYASYVILEANKDCPVFVKFRKSPTYHKWGKGLVANVPLVIKSPYPVIHDIKVKPTSSTNFEGWATTGTEIAEVS